VAAYEYNSTNFRHALLLLIIVHIATVGITAIAGGIFHDHR